MLEKLSFTEVNGGDSDRTMILIGSEKCDFFRSALELLTEMRLGFKWAVLDSLELEEMQAVVAYLKRKYTENVVCPFLIYDDKCLSGFDRSIWIEKILEKT